MKWVVAIFILGIGLVALTTGCTASELIKNNVDICSLINCSQLGIVDIAGPRNTLVPSEPNYGHDPTCTLPGMCGPSIYYPYSQGSTESTESSE